VSKIEIGRYSELLRRALGMAGTDVVAGELSPEISPTWVLEADPPELAILKSVRLVASSGALGPVAGQSARYLLTNPVGSGMVAVVTNLSVSAPIAYRVVVRMIRSELANFGLGPNEAGSRDSRWERPTASVSPIIFSQENNALVIAGGFPLDDAFVRASERYSYTSPVILAPSSSVFWGLVTQNTAASAAVSWYERPLPFLERP